jgi:dTDP-4-amino-4,6-dideoxygalactose transaminase
VISQTNLKEYYLRYKQAIDEAIGRTLNSGWYILGSEVAAFEKEFADYLGVARAVGTGSGTDSLQLSLRCLGVGPGDVVATVSHTAVATVAAIQLAGATPLLVDIDPDSYTMDPSSLEKALEQFARSCAMDKGRRIKAIIPVHLYGHPADMHAICAVADQHDLFVIEDCAQAAGAELDDRKLGSFGDMAAFSFYPTKNLGALGDGGALVTNDSDLAERARKLREYGWHNRLSVLERGINSRLDEIQAAVLRVRLSGLDRDNIERSEIADFYSRNIKKVGLPYIRKGCAHVYHQYVIRTPRRDDLKRYLEKHGVMTAIHYPMPVHLQPAYRGSLYEHGSLQVTELICGEILSLPIYPGLAKEDQEQVCCLIDAFEAS